MNGFEILNTYCIDTEIRRSKIYSNGYDVRCAHFDTNSNTNLKKTVMMIEKPNDRSYLYTQIKCDRTLCQREFVPELN